MNSASGIRVGNAPISYGVFGDLTVEAATTPADLLLTMAAAGYEGSEIGPPGFFGTEAELVSAFEAAGIAAIGAYVPLHTQASDEFLQRDLDRMEQTLSELLTVNPRALVILADEGSDALIAHPRHADELGLDEEGWTRLFEVVQGAVNRVDEVGLTASFHPHIATYIEQPHEIERLLESTSVGLTYDIGHIVLGGGEPVATWRAWRDRINHIHLKDVRLAVFEQAIASRRADFETWWAELCTPLGAGDLDVGAFVDTLHEDGYVGWLVVEQDRGPLVDSELDQTIQNQNDNLAWTRERLARHAATDLRAHKK